MRNAYQGHTEELKDDVLEVGSYDFVIESVGRGEKEWGCNDLNQIFCLA
jgi:hypothetical protein